MNNKHHDILFHIKILQKSTIDLSFDPFAHKLFDLFWTSGAQ